MEETPKAKGCNVLRKKRNLFSLPGLPKKDIIFHSAGFRVLPQHPGRFWCLPAKSWSKTDAKRASVTKDVDSCTDKVCGVEWPALGRLDEDFPGVLHSLNDHAWTLFFFLWSKSWRASSAEPKGRVDEFVYMHISIGLHFSLYRRKEFLKELCAPKNCGWSQPPPTPDGDLDIFTFVVLGPHQLTF